MVKRMLIDAAHPEETRVVVLNGNKLEEFDFETSTKKQIKGNIYLAKVTRVEPSLQAAFVEYGGNRHGFLAFNEIHPDYYRIPVADRQAALDAERAAEQAANAREEARERRRAETAEDEPEPHEDEHEPHEDEHEAPYESPEEDGEDEPDDGNGAAHAALAAPDDRLHERLPEPAEDDVRFAPAAPEDDDVLEPGTPDPRDALEGGDAGNGIESAREAARSAEAAGEMPLPEGGEEAATARRRGGARRASERGHGTACLDRDGRRRRARGDGAAARAALSPLQDPGSHQAPPDHAGPGREGRARQQGRGADDLSLARRPLLRADAEHAARRRRLAQDHQRRTTGAA